MVNPFIFTTTFILFTVVVTRKLLYRKTLSLIKKKCIGKTLR